MTIDAKPMQYAGNCFRSILEVRWAVFFDALGIKWEYESDVCRSVELYYLPDFWLPDYESFVEIKPYSYKFDGFEKCEALAQKRPLMVLCGVPASRGLQAWAAVGGKLVPIPNCEWCLCRTCGSPVLVTHLKGEGGKDIFGLALQPAKEKCPHRLHNLVREPLDCVPGDTLESVKAKWKLSSAYAQALRQSTRLGD